MAETNSCIAIASALSEEIGGLVDRVVVERCDTWAGQEVTTGTLGDRRVVLMHTGTGPERARRGIATLLDRRPVSALCYVGVAGALDPSLSVESMLVPTSVQTEDGQSVPSPALQWADRTAAMGDGEVYTGSLVTVDRVITQPEEKAALRDALALNGPAAIDMETAAVARVAAEREVPYLSLRIISDTADESLPDLLKDAQRDDGSIDRTRVMQSAAWSPSAVPALMRMRRRVQSAAGILAERVPTALHYWERKGT
jgi:nucleoside phosphorylase